MIFILMRVIRRTVLAVAASSFLFASNTGSAQVLDGPRDQPLDFSARSTPLSSQCCRAAQESADELLQCGLSTAALLPGDRASALPPGFNITLVSYMTPDIFSYAAYSLALTSMYAEHLGYAMHVVTNSSAGSGGDQRWAKVRVMLDFLQRSAVTSPEDENEDEDENENDDDAEEEEEGGGEYAVWLDSDVLILDMGLRLEQVALQMGPRAHLILSADSQVEMGVANSGLVMVRNTRWARAFLRQWLLASASGGAAGASPQRMMDQLAFDKLYRSQLPGISRKVVVLRPDALNSEFPAWKHQRARSQVLHLAASSSLLRRSVFRQGLATVCSHLYPQPSSTPRLPRQLGLSRETLLALRQALPVEDTVLQESLALQQRLLELQADGGTGGGAEGVQQLLTSLEDALRHAKRLSGRQDVHESLLAALGGSRAFFLSERFADPPRLLAQLHSLLAIAFRYALMLLPDASQTVRAEEAFSLSQELLLELLPLARAAGGVSLLKQLLFYEHKRLFSCAELASRVQPDDERRALQLYERAIAAWWERRAIVAPVLQVQGPGGEEQEQEQEQQVQLDPCSEAVETLYRLAVLSCSPQLLSLAAPGQEARRQQLRAGLGNVTRSLALHAEVWGAVSREQVPQQVRLMLAKTLVAGGDCLRQAGTQVEEAAAAGRYREARRELEALSLPALQEQAEALLVHVDSSLAFADAAARTLRAGRGGGEEVDAYHRAGGGGGPGPGAEASSAPVAKKKVLRRRKKPSGN